MAPQAQGEIGEALAQISAEMSAKAATAYRHAQRSVLVLVRAGKLDEPALFAFAKNGQFEETVAALSALSRLPIEAVEQILRGDRLDALLIVGRAIGIDWATAKAVIVLRAGRVNGYSLDDAQTNFERLPRQGAQRVLQFWRDRARKKFQPT